MDLFSKITNLDPAIAEHKKKVLRLCFFFSTFKSIMSWSNLYTINSTEKIFVIAGILIGIFSGIFFSLGIIEFIHATLSKLIACPTDNVKTRFILRVLLFWISKLASLAVAICAIALVAYTDDPANVTYVQQGLFGSIGLCIVWRVVVIIPEFPRHVHCIMHFSGACRATFPRHSNDHATTKDKESWLLIDANAHFLIYLVSLAAQPQSAQRVITKEHIPISDFTNSRHSVHYKRPPNLI
jgi:hypothetical protein